MQGETPQAYFILLTGTCALYIRDDDEDGLGMFLNYPGLSVMCRLPHTARTHGSVVFR